MSHNLQLSNTVIAGTHSANVARPYHSQVHGLTSMTDAAEILETTTLFS